MGIIMTNATTLKNRRIKTFSGRSLLLFFLSFRLPPFYHAPEPVSFLDIPFVINISTVPITLLNKLAAVAKEY